MDQTDSKKANALSHHHHLLYGAVSQLGSACQRVGGGHTFTRTYTDTGRPSAINQHSLNNPYHTHFQVRAGY